MTAWQLQETFRRALIARMRYSASVWGDALFYMGQAAAVGALTYFHRLSLTAVFLTMIATSLAKSAMRAASGQLGRQIARGLLSGILGGSGRRR